MGKHSRVSPDWGKLRNKVLGLGEYSMRKSYYSESRYRLAQLNRFRTLLDKAHDCILFAMMPKGKLADANATAMKRLGFSFEQNHELSLREVIGQEAFNDIAQQFSEHQKGEPSLSPAGAFHHYVIKGTDFEVTVSFDQIENDVYAVVVLHDICKRLTAENEKKKLEEQLQQSQKMEAIGQLAGGIAHDFNNLLTGITGNIALTLMDLDAQDPLCEMLKEIQSAADRASNLTRQLLAFSRKQIVQPIVISPNTIASDLEKMLARLIGEDIRLTLRLDETVGNIKIDPGQFEQVIVNLVVNARDAMPNGGHLSISIRNVRLEPENCVTIKNIEAGFYVMVAVNDTGCGMSKETRTHIFEPFFTTKPKFKGTGLGLSTVYGIVNQNGGCVNVYSEPGIGTTFKLYFPLIEKAPDKERTFEQNEMMPQGHETILYVEDEDLVRKMTTKILRKLGYKVLSAENGSMALMHAQKFDGIIDLLVTDVIMPGMNGREVSEAVQTYNPKIRTLFTSGYTEDIIVHHGVLDEDVQFIAKPYTPGSLARKIRSILE